MPREPIRGMLDLGDAIYTYGQDVVGELLANWEEIGDDG